MTKSTQVKGYNIPSRDYTWYWTRLELTYHKDALLSLISECQSDDQMELLWRYLAERRRQAQRNEESWAEAELLRRQGETSLNEATIGQYIEYWKNVNHQVAATMNFIKVVLGVDPLEWDVTIPYGAL